MSEVVEADPVGVIQTVLGVGVFGCLVAGVCVAPASQVVVVVVVYAAIHAGLQVLHLDAWVLVFHVHVVRNVWAIIADHEDYTCCGAVTGVGRPLIRVARATVMSPGAVLSSPSTTHPSSTRYTSASHLDLNVHEPRVVC